jgi:hypothetical protein
MEYFSGKLLMKTQSSNIILKNFKAPPFNLSNLFYPILRYNHLFIQLEGIFSVRFSLLKYFVKIFYKRMGMRKILIIIVNV